MSPAPAKAQPQEILPGAGQAHVPRAELASTQVSLERSCIALLYCRPGFERDCAVEFAAAVGSPRAALRFTQAAGYAEVALEGAGHALDRWPSVDALVFARQAARRIARIDELPQRDRLRPIVEVLKAAGVRVGRIVAETPDTDEAKTLSRFIGRFTPLLDSALREAGVLADPCGALETLHVFFLDGCSVLLAVSDPRFASPHRMGVRRLRRPGRSPSRSALKLVEALAVLVGEERLARRMLPGGRAVDLGAAPGSWSLQLAQRGLQVSAVDNARLDPEVLATGMVEHLRADAFHFRPRSPVAWMVCDVVEQPIRVAGLAADWIARGWCRDAIVNLKLPMKKRYEEWLRCRERIVAALARGRINASIAAKQLYHDREEITLYLSRQESSGKATARSAPGSARR